MARAVCGVLEHPPAAHAAVQDLLDSGFLRENISVVAREGDKGAGAPGSVSPPAAPPSGAPAGAGAGTALGGVAGLLLGLGALAIPGLGPLVAAGPLAAALAGAGAGAVAGGLMGALTDLGVSEDEARSNVARSPAPNTTASTETRLTRAEYRRSRPLRLRAGGRQRLATAPARR